MIFGPAGAGKSTQAIRLAEETGRVWLSAGQISRDYFAEYTKTAAMVPEETLAEAILTEIEKAEAEGKGVVFDGQPWSVEGARILGEKGILGRVEVLLVLDVPREESLKRLAARGRADDNAANWNKKLEMYEQKICSFLTEVERQGVAIRHVDGTGTIDEVRTRIADSLAG